MSVSKHVWWAITNFGDAGLTVPLAAALAGWLAIADRYLAVRWLLMLAVGAAIVGVTKILYAGCGIEIEAIGFRVVSGHSMLASAVWPGVFAVLAYGIGRQYLRVGIGIGVLAAITIGVSRFFVNAHSVSEIIAGVVVGLAVVLVFLRIFEQRAPQLPDARYTALAAVGFAIIVVIAYGHGTPIQALIDRWSPSVCRQLLGLS
ncbi:MAG: phosphatase PAP2 family protein [Janthinobacterium lividum]